MLSYMHTNYTIVGDANTHKLNFLENTKKRDAVIIIKREEGPGFSIKSRTVSSGIRISTMFSARHRSKREERV